MKKENHKNDENVSENHQKPSGDSSPPADDKRGSKRRVEDNLLADLKKELDNANSIQK